MKIIKKIGNAIYSLLLLVLVLLILGTTFSLVEAPGGLRVYMVQSGSMEPEVKTGSLAITKTQSEYRASEVVTFLAKPRSKMAENGPTVMHRIVGTAEVDRELSYKTKGDANRSEDPDPVLPTQVLGKVLFTLPYAGYAVAFARTKMGFLSLIAVPAFFVMVFELLSIKGEICKILAGRKKKVGGIRKGKVVKVVALVLGVVGLTSLVAVGGMALLSDGEKAGVTLNTGRWGQGPPLVCEFKGHKNMFHFGIFNHGHDFNSFSYELIYTAGGVTQGVIGGSQELEDEFKTDIFLGTCSDEDCVEDENFDDLELTVTLDGFVKRQLGCRWGWMENRGWTKK